MDKGLQQTKQHQWWCVDECMCKSMHTYVGISKGGCEIDHIGQNDHVDAYTSVGQVN